MTEPTQNELIEQVKDYLRLLDDMYVVGDSFATHLNVAEQINYFIEKLEFLKHKN